MWILLGLLPKREGQQRGSEGQLAFQLDLSHPQRWGWAFSAPHLVLGQGRGSHQVVSFPVAGG